MICFGINELETWWQQWDDWLGWWLGGMPKMVLVSTVDRSIFCFNGVGPVVQPCCHFGFGTRLLTKFERLHSDNIALCEAG